VKPYSTGLTKFQTKTWGEVVRGGRGFGEAFFKKPGGEELGSPVLAKAAVGGEKKRSVATKRTEKTGWGKRRKEEKKCRLREGSQLFTRKARRAIAGVGGGVPGEKSQVRTIAE